MMSRTRKLTFLNIRILPWPNIRIHFFSTNPSLRRSIAYVQSNLSSFPHYCGVLVKLSVLTGVPISVVRGEPVHRGLQSSASKTRNFTVSCGLQHFDRLSVDHQCGCVTDGQQ